MFQENVEQWKKKLLWEGELKGELKGEARMLSRQIQRRFGDAPSWASDKLAKADLPAMPNLCRMFLGVPTKLFISKTGNESERKIGWRYQY